MRISSVKLVFPVLAMNPISQEADEASVEERDGNLQLLALYTVSSFGFSWFNHRRIKVQIEQWRENKLPELKKKQERACHLIHDRAEKLQKDVAD